jgi:hypothetical protein
MNEANNDRKASVELLCVVRPNPVDASLLPLQLLIGHDVPPFGFEGCCFELLILPEFSKLLLKSCNPHPDGAILGSPGGVLIFITVLMVISKFSCELFHQLLISAFFVWQQTFNFKSPDQTEIYGCSQGVFGLRERQKAGKCCAFTLQISHHICEQLWHQ